MGFYSKYIFPHILDWSLGDSEFGEYRRCALQLTRGDTLEIGFGTGLNLPYYPEAITGLTAIDSENMLEDRVKNRIAACQFPVKRMRLDAQGRLPFEDHSFDTVVTTMTLCSIPEAAATLAEIRRTLKVDGHFVFLEHGRSDDPKVARRQDLFNPIQKIIGAGCNLNRKIDGLIETAGFKIIRLDRFQAPNIPRILAEIYRGVARP